MNSTLKAFLQSFIGIYIRLSTLMYIILNVEVSGFLLHFFDYYLFFQSKLPVFPVYEFSGVPVEMQAPDFHTVLVGLANYSK